MADYTNKVEIDTSFLLGVDGEKQLFVSFSPQELNYTGYSNIFTAIELGITYSTIQDIFTTIFAGSCTSFLIDKVTEISVSSLTNTYINKQLQYTRSTVISGSINKYVAYTLPVIFAPSYRKLLLQYTAGRQLIIGKNLITTLCLLEDMDGTKPLLVNYMNYTGYNDFYYNPLPAWEDSLDLEMLYTVGSGTDVGWDRLVEIFFAGWIPHNLSLDTFCSTCNTFCLVSDIGLTYGVKEGLVISCQASLLEQEVLNFDLFCSLLGEDYYYTDVEITPGYKGGLGLSLFSSTEVINTTFNVAIGMFPIYFDNFSLAIGEYTTSSGTICVDAHDGTYTLTSSGTYLMIDGVQVDTILTLLVDGYRVCYNPEDNFSSLSGATEFTIHAENDNGDILEETFYLTFGYIVEFDNKNNIGLNYGFSNKVAVRIEAENLASCPNTVIEGYWFVSEEKVNRDLGASIICQGATQQGNKNLSASIYPHSTAYFYDKNIRVVLTAKDFSGNEMVPFVLEFKIKNDG